MPAVRPCAVLLLFSLAVAGHAQAQPTAATARPLTDLTSGTEFLAMYDAGDATWRVILLSTLGGAVDGLSVASVILVGRQQKPLFCLTDNARITGQAALDLMRQQVTAAPSHGSAPWGLLLALSLMFSFPCAPP